LGRPIRTNGAIFLQNYTDAQVSRVVVVNGTATTITDNAARAELWGGELEALLRLTDNLELGVNANYLHFAYTEFAPGVSAATILSTRWQEHATPTWKYGVSARYHVPRDPTIGDISLSANWNWQARFIRGTANLGLQPIESYGLLNLSADWDRIGGSAVDASL